MHSRYVLKTKDTNEVLFVAVFSLLHKEDVEKEEAAEEAKRRSGGGGTELTSGETTDEARHEGEKEFEPDADDLDQHKWLLLRRETHTHGAEDTLES